MTDTGPVPIVIAPATVIAPVDQSTEAEKDAAARRIQEERVAPTTTAEQDRKTQAQRHINLTWETTQAVIAMTVTLATVTTCGFIVVYGEGNQKEAAFLLLSNVFFMVIATYFSRTNHTKSAEGPDEKRGMSS